MKSAEEWHHTPKFISTCLANNKKCSCVACNHLRLVQLDARKQGMTDAAEIASFLDGDTPSVTSHGRSRLEAKKAILNARDKLK